MHILNTGRSAFLEFLRNLTPQILLATLAFLSFFRAAVVQPLGLKVGLAFMGVVFSLALLVAALANSIQFIVNYHLAHPKLRNHTKDQVINSINELQKFAKLHEHKVSLSVLLLLLLAEIVFLGALAIAAFNALKLIGKA